MYILGVNSAYHESAACLLKDGTIVAAAEEERFNRVKHAKVVSLDNPDQLPVNAIRHCLASASIDIGAVEYAGYSINPSKRLKNRDFKDNVTESGWGSSSGEAHFFKKLQLVPEKLTAMGFKGRFLWLDHHLCHAASAFYPSPFKDAAVLTIDGIGETSSTMLSFGKGRTLSVLQEIMYPASLGFVWEKLSKFLGFGEYDAGKIMGLGAYGDPANYLEQFKQIVKLGPEGTFETDNTVLCFRAEEYAGLEKLFGIKRRDRSQPLTQVHQDLAASLQKITDSVLVHLTNYLYERTQSKNLCMAGGVALNCMTNKVLYENGPFTGLYIQPAANDAGTALGAALIIWNDVLGHEFRQTMNHTYWGPAFSESEVEEILIEHGLVYERVEDIERKVATLLSQNKIVGWFQGAMEFGPRALGNRSLLADPRDPTMRDKLNARVKHREPFRPYASSVIEEEAHKWFQILKPTDSSDFMLIAYSAQDELKDKIPAVVHVDGTCRIQTVRQTTNPKYHKLIAEFFKITGVPMVLNTSFNDQEPIVCTPHHAIDTFIKTEMDGLAIGNYFIDKKEQNQASS